MSVHKVNFRQNRHVENSKLFLRRSLHAVESLKGRVAGYAVVVWDDSGSSYTTYRTGGPVGIGSLTTYVAEQLFNTSIHLKND